MMAPPLDLQYLYYFISLYFKIRIIAEIDIKNNCLQFMKVQFTHACGNTLIIPTISKAG